MDTLQYEAVKIAMKQDKEGYVLTLRVHPDEVPQSLFTDFVGARYQVVMVRIGDDDRPLNRDNFSEAVKLAGMLCRDKMFATYLMDQGFIFDDDEETVIGWMKDELSIQSRSELKTNKEAAAKLKEINARFQEWKRNG
jgi:hypothetical protein